MSQWKLGNSGGGTYKVPAQFAGMSDRWCLRFNQGRDAKTGGHDYDIRKGRAHWLGYVWVVGARLADDFKPHFSYSELSQDIEATLEMIALTDKQFPHWTPFYGKDDITALMVWQFDGELREVWATSSSTPYSIDAVFYPLPVHLTGYIEGKDEQ